MTIKMRISDGKRVGSKGELLHPAIILYRESHPKSEDIESIQSLDRSKADNLLVVGTSLKMHGSVSLIKTMSTFIKKRKGGGVYYLDLASPPKDVKVFDHILQVDCQDFAKQALDHLEKSKFTVSASVDGDRTKTNFAIWWRQGGFERTCVHHGTGHKLGSIHIINLINLNNRA